MLYRDIRILTGLALGTLSVFALPDRLRADSPEFSESEVTVYIQKLTQFCDDYVAASVQAANGDDRQVKRLDAAFPQLQSKAAGLLDKLKPGETKLFTEYIANCGQRMLDAEYGMTMRRLPTNGR